ncbi:TonB-dependent receptor plug domain-containing protein, partial [Methyloversatilis discipulorum]|uniref:TonB-dependent receptor plug domain-containing protein n=1 Tax=Methyloversatilis discipulorum TaxID=1119528 RepID=UPI003137D5F9
MQVTRRGLRTPARSMRKTTVALAVAAIMQAPLAAHAETIVLPRIDVIAGGENAIEQQPGSVSIVGPTQIEQIQPLSTEDALRTVPGVHIKGEEESGIVANIG